MKKIKVCKRDVGRFCLVRWSDVGVNTNLIVNVETDSRWVTPYDLEDRETIKADREQIVSLGKYMTIPADAI